MNLILESPASVPYFTDVGRILKAAGLEIRNFDWYVSDVETNIDVPDLLAGSRWFTGDELAQVLAIDRLQFIWGVLSAVPKGMRCPIEAEPFVDGNRSYWLASEARPQLPSALLEVACWDSSATILLGLSEEQAVAFKKAFPEARLLSEASVGS
jgi:hypothetical protein